jgi:hypothetical protein
VAPNPGNLAGTNPLPLITTKTMSPETQAQRAGRKIWAKNEAAKIQALISPWQAATRLAGLT